MQKWRFESQGQSWERQWFHTIQLCVLCVSLTFKYEGKPKIARHLRKSSRMKSQGQNKQKNTSWSKDYTRKREYKKKKLYPQMDNTSIGGKKKKKKHRILFKRAQRIINRLIQKENDFWPGSLYSAKLSTKSTQKNESKDLPPTRFIHRKLPCRDCAPLTQEGQP